MKDRTKSKCKLRKHIKTLKAQNPRIVRDSTVSDMDEACRPAGRALRKRPTPNFDPKQWMKMERRGDCIVLAEPSGSTPTVMRNDCQSLYWSARQLGQWVSQKKTKGEPPTVEEAQKDFAGTILVGDKSRVPYVTNDELKAQIDHPQAPSSFAEDIAIRRWGFTEATGKTYLHRKIRSKPPS